MRRAESSHVGEDGDGPQRAEEQFAIEGGGGAHEDGGAERRCAVERSPGPAILSMLCASWQDVQKARLASQQRGLVGLAEGLKKIEDSTARQIKKELMAQPVWPWLSQFPGLGGVHVARLVAMIGDPRRFPGQKCSEGHTSLPDYAVGDPCPVEGMDGTRCPGAMLTPRTTTGTRALWHYLGLHVGDDGKMPRKRKGHRIDWNGEGRTICLMPGGLAEQIVRLRVPVYRDRYDATKARLIETRAGEAYAIERTCGPQGGGGAERVAASDVDAGLTPIQIEKRARMIAVKAFVGDLLAAMKRAADSKAAIEMVRGRLPIAGEDAA
jgi:hypothetical protein